MLSWRSWNGFLFALMLTISAPFSLSITAQDSSVVRIPPEALREQTAIREILEEGRQHEQAGRWRDAVRAYEEGVRKYDADAIRQRLSIARAHFDIDRRYHDTSYLRTVDDTNIGLAHNVLAEVLMKVDAYHVDSPNWTEVAQRATYCLDVALDEASFRERNLSQVSPDENAKIRQQLAHLVRSRTFLNRHDVYDYAMELSDRLQRDWGIHHQAVVYEFVCSALSSLDWYSAFLTPDHYDEVISQIDGNFVGLGVELNPLSDRLEIVDVIPNGPAGESGLAIGENIIAVDGAWVTAIGGNAAADRLRGPEGSLVELLVDGRDGNRRTLRIRRRMVEIPSLTSVRMVEQGVGYIHIGSFQRTTIDEFQNAMWKLHRDGMRSLIVDVRGNPGGLLDASVDVANLFISNGTIVTTKGRNPNEDRVRTAKFEGTWQVPLVVLIDGDSASASEIFAGAIRDHQRGVLIGDQTYGKGTVQGIFPLNSNGGGIRLTTAKFYSPKGQPISQRGVRPDIKVQQTLKPVLDHANPPADSADAVLNTGIREALRMQHNQR